LPAADVKFALRLRRKNGKRLQWKDVINRPPLVGDLGTFYVEQDGCRYFVACLREPTAPAQGSLAELYEPVLFNVTPHAMGLRGFETGGYVQEWHLELLS
jgi:hypothetical protein